MKISIAMATFNGAHYVSGQLATFLNQERAPDELVVCDDVSTDDTVKILEEFKQRVPFNVVVVKNDHNLGFTKNFEKALSLCTGDLIFISDQDDIWFPNKISALEKAFLDNPARSLVIHNGVLADENGVSSGMTKLSQIVAGYGSEDSFTTGALTVIRREFLSYALPIPDGIVGHDGWLHNIAQLLGKRLVLKQSLQYIRRHSLNTSEWVVNSLKPINRLSVAKSQFSTTTSSCYQDRMIYNISLTDRLVYIESLDESICSATLITLGLDFLRSERKAIINRQELVLLGFVRRKTKALKMQFCGEYKHFNGFKSFMRDLVR